MAILPILHFPDLRLRNPSQPVARVDDELRTLLDDMLQTMYEAPGIGLAAPQVNVFKRAIVIDISEERNAPHYFVNPEIVERRGTEEFEEGCLSVHNINEKVQRAEWIRVKALGRAGQPFEIAAAGLLAVFILQDFDHLVGLLFVDYLSVLKCYRIRIMMEILRRLTLCAERRPG